MCAGSSTRAVAALPAPLGRRTWQRLGARALWWQGPDGTKDGEGLRQQETRVDEPPRASSSV
eukprot:scaffold193172_cov31-Tisochrysis_lutea.AAC.1